MNQPQSVSPSWSARFSELPEAVPFPFLLPPVQPDEIGRLGSFRVLKLLGRGGMGYVFQAEDLTLCRPVALKVMNPQLGTEPGAWQRFLREARVMAAIKHEALVTVYQAAQEGGVVFLAMELLQGQTLQDWLERGERPVLDEIYRLASEIATGLAVIHDHGLVHRDIKPANLWLEAPAAHVKILDFGLARFVSDEPGLTRTGTVLGTPSFMSPEQARGEPVDLRSDLFSFGCVLYCLCTGGDPFPGRTTTAVLTALATSQPPPVHQVNPALPAALSNLVARLLAKDPRDRPPSAGEVLEELRALERGQAPPPVASATRRIRPQCEPESAAGGRHGWAWAVALVAAVAFAAPLLWHVLNRPVNPAAAPEGPAPAIPAVEQGATYLTALKPSGRENWPFLPPTPPGLPPLKAYGSGRVQGKVDPHSIFMHPPPVGGPAVLQYALGKQYNQFHATVNLNDGPADAMSSCAFAVHGDGRLLWQSRPIRSQADGQTCSVSVRGVADLRLEVRCLGKDPRGLHAIWLGPRLTK